MNEFARQLTTAVRYSAFGGPRVHDPVGFEISHDGATLKAETPRFAAADWLRDRGRDEEADSVQWHDGGVFAGTDGTVRRLPQAIHVEGRRWHQHTYGNTYHSTVIHVDGHARLQLPTTYGYGDQYLQTAIDGMVGASILPSDNRPTEDLRRWAERHGVTFTHAVQDVRRRRDL